MFLQYLLSPYKRAFCFCEYEGSCSFWWILISWNNIIRFLECQRRIILYYSNKKIINLEENKSLKFIILTLQHEYRLAWKIVKTSKVSFDHHLIFLNLISCWSKHVLTHLHLKKFLTIAGLSNQSSLFILFLLYITNWNHIASVTFKMNLYHSKLFSWLLPWWAHL